MLLEGHRPARGNVTTYLVLALGNASRETACLGRFWSLDQATQYLAAYSPKLKLIGR